MESKFSIGSVLGDTFGTIGSNPLATLGVAFLIGVLPVEILSYLLLGTTVVNRTQIFTTPNGIWLYFAFILVSIFCSVLVQATLVRVTVAHAREERVSIGASLAAALPKVLPLLGLTIIMAIGIGFGMLLLIVPGVILYLIWSVASPALVAEDIGVFEAFGRSSELTKGNRVKIFGMFFLLGALLIGVSMVLGFFLVATGTLQGLVTGSIPIAYTLINAIVSTLTTAISGALVATLYVQLRVAKEGPAVDALADVFA